MKIIKALKFLWNEKKPKPSDYNSSLMMVVNASKNTDRRKVNASRRKVCKKEPETCEWIRSFKKGVFYDIGACVGGYSLPAWHEGCKVYAFEPSFANFNTLCRNIELNQADIVPIYTALTGETSMLPFGYKSTLDGKSGNSLEEVGSFRLEIPTFKLDDFVRIFQIPHPDYLKIDIDGGEDKLLKGAQETIKHARSILVESFSDDVADFLPGFELYAKYPNYTSHNYLFRNRQQ